MKTEELIRKIDDKLLELSEAPNTKKFVWFDFNTALRKLNEQFEKEGYNDYHKRIAGQYINVFNDLYNWPAETIGISCLAYNSETKIATMQQITNVNYNGHTASVKTYEQKIGADRQNYYETLKLPESDYAIREDTIKMEYLLRDCNIDFPDYEGTVNPFEMQMFERRMDKHPADYRRFFSPYINTDKHSYKFERYIRKIKADRAVEEVDGNDEDKGADIKIENAVKTLTENNRIINSSFSSHLKDAFTSGRSKQIIQINSRKFTDFYRVFEPLWFANIISKKFHKSEYDFICNNFQVNKKDIPKNTISGAKHRDNW